ncbi:MAG: imidazole glycerol phosphate synthase subunit HisF [Candidatus Brocadiia bacterium]
MLAKRIIPCLDVKNGRVVKGISFGQLRDAGDPVECAATYSKEGADELVFLDITATLQARETIRGLVTRIAECISIPFTVGGGISSEQHINQLLSAGADKVSINTAAVRSPELIEKSSRSFGCQCIVVAIDAQRSDDGGWEVYVESGRTPTEHKAVDWARHVEEYGAGEILLTSIDSDGQTTGYDIELNAAISEAVEIPVIASGGAGGPEHIFKVLTEGQADAALAASIFHYGEYSVSEVKSYLAQRNVHVRL